MADYWFVWSDDYEPIRVEFSTVTIAEAVYRFHWIHYYVKKPYTNEEGKIEVLFFPVSHTPAIREEKLDLDFYILVSSLGRHKIDSFEVTDEEVPSYFKEKGRKDRHWPPMDYGGWMPLM